MASDLKRKLQNLQSAFCLCNNFVSFGSLEVLEVDFQVRFQSVREIQLSQCARVFDWVLGERASTCFGRHAEEFGVDVMVEFETVSGQVAFVQDDFRTRDENLLVVRVVE